MSTGKGSEHLYTAAFRNFRLHILQQLFFFRIKPAPVQFSGIAHMNNLDRAGLLVFDLSVDCIKAKRVVRVAKESVEHETREAGITRILLERLLDRFQNVRVSLRQFVVHVHGDYRFRVTRQTPGDILQRNECGVRHQVFAEEQWNASGPTLYSDRCFRRLGACVVRGIAFDYFLADAIGALEDTATLSTPRLAVPRHLWAIEALQHPKDVVSITSGHRAGKPDNPLRNASENSQAVALGGVAGELVQLVRDGIVEESLHVAAHVIERRHALQLDR